MKKIAAVIVAVLLSHGAIAQDVVRTADPVERGLSEADFPRVQRLASNVYTYEALTGSPDDRYTTNSMFVVTAEGVLVADGQGSPDETARLVAAIAEITPVPISHIVMGSDHGDHTSGNSAFPDSATFIAHPNLLANLRRTASNPDRDAKSPPVVLPDRLVEEREVLRLGDTEIQILFLGRAHTGGDLLVYLPDAKILFTSEIFLNHMFSGYRSAYPSEWLAVMDEAEKLDVEIYIPGHGFIDDPKILEQEWHDYKAHMRVVLDEVKRLHAAGKSVDEPIEQADFGRFAEWSGADFQGPIGIRRIYDELNGELP